MLLLKTEGIHVFSGKSRADRQGGARLESLVFFLRRCRIGLAQNCCKLADPKSATTNFAADASNKQKKVPTVSWVEPQTIQLYLPDTTKGFKQVGTLGYRFFNLTPKMFNSSERCALLYRSGPKPRRTLVARNITAATHTIDGPAGVSKT